jgi:hypothetical protein
LLIVRNPRQFGIAWDQAPLSYAAETSARRVATAADGIIGTQAFLNQVVVKQPNRSKALLERGVGQPTTRVDYHHFPTLRIWARGQIADVGSDVLSRGEVNLGVGSRAEEQIIL